MKIDAKVKKRIETVSSTGSQKTFFENDDICFESKGVRFIGKIKKIHAKKRYLELVNLQRIKLAGFREDLPDQSFYFDDIDEVEYVYYD